jgi:hypothetical protein
VNQPCAVCTSVGIGPQPAAGTVALTTALPELIARAEQRFDEGGTEVAQLLVRVGPDHAVVVYRGGVPGVAIAWGAAATSL